MADRRRSPMRCFRDVSMRGKIIRYSIGVIAGGAAACVFEFTSLDLWLQDRFFDASTKRWMVDGRSAVPRLVFYDGPKVFLGAVALCLLGAILGPASWRRRLAERGWRASRLTLLAALTAAALIPIVVGKLKSTSGVFCPSELVRYGGAAPHLRPYSTEICELPERGHCWPAGHASGGFALLSLLAIAEGPSRRRLVAAVAVLLGSGMGVYQMLKGAHFLSHTLVTVGVALLIAGLGEVISEGFSRRRNQA